MSDGQGEVTIPGGPPYLSLVVTARNDDHGGNLLGRMQIFVDGWLAQARRYQIPSELIIVEWNPPADRPRLADALRWPAFLGPCSVRIIEVPSALHQRYAHADALPLYQMIAKNVGIRRARGRFILATNIDILVSNELAAFFSTRSLEFGRMYRIDRHDAMSAVPGDAPIDEQLAYCRSHLIRVNRRDGTVETTTDGRPKLSALDITTHGSGLSLGSGWYPVEWRGPNEVFRWAKDTAELLLGNPPSPTAVLTIDLDAGRDPDGVAIGVEVGTDGDRLLGSVQMARPGRFQMSLSQPLPERLWIRTTGKPANVAGDLRLLFIRVFGIEWRVNPGTDATSAVAIVPRSRIYRIHMAVQDLIVRAADSRRISVTLPVPKLVRSVLRGYLKRGGVTGMCRTYLLRQRIASSGDERCRPASGGLAGAPINGAPDFLHTNGCGDFTLMAREHWFDLRGYPEFDLFSMNLDSLFCFAAHYGGAPEHVLSEPMRIYHIEHGTGSGWTPEGQTKLFERIAARGLSFLQHREIMELAAAMHHLKAPMIFNHENWGLVDFDLNETQRRPADTEGTNGQR